MTEPPQSPTTASFNASIVQSSEAVVSPSPSSHLQEEKIMEDQSEHSSDVLTDEEDNSPSPTAPTSTLEEKEQKGMISSFSTDKPDKPHSIHNDENEKMTVGDEKEKVTSLPVVAAQSQHHDIEADTKLKPNDGCDLEKDAKSQLLGLPIDSLHAIATFLTPNEWACFGQCNKASLRTTREVFRRVRMHGFRCATEIVTAWKLGQFADAKELCALYVEAGVPIYPRSLGHSYHTLVWRAAVEAKQLASLNSRSAQRTTNNLQEDNIAESDPIDPFYVDRQSEQERDDGRSDRVSYLEEKAWYVLKNCERKDSLGNIRRLRRRVSFNNQDLARTTAMMVEPMVEGGVVDDVALNRPHVEANIANETSNTQRRGRSNSHSELRCVDTKELIRIHRHLLDQHLLGRNSVNDNHGMMYTAPFSMSIDFFHPSFSVKQRCSSTKGYTATRAFASSSDGFVQGHLLPVWNNQTAPSGGGIDVTAMGRQNWLQSRQRLISDVMDDSSSETDVPVQRPAPLAESIFEPSGNDVVEAAHRPILHASLSSYRPSSNHGTPTNFLNLVDLEVYSTASVETKLDLEHHELKSHLRTRFTVYQERLEGMLARRDDDGFEECVLDFWDEFFSETANIHYYDCRTAVPRISRLPEFLSTPCPKGIGTVQCEIKRIKLTNKKKGVNMKGRFFPTYEYRLFIRHTPVDHPNQSEPCRKDTVLMTARTRGRKLVDTPNHQPQVHSNTKKGANNYFLYTPLRKDVVQHYSSANDTADDSAQISNGSSKVPASDSSSVLMGRLQSNFIGTEFQIFTPLANQKNRNSIGSPHRFCPVSDEECGGYDSSVSCENSSRRKNRFGRLSLKRSNTGQFDRASSVEPEALRTDNPARSFRRRSRSSGDTPPKRTNRRAIANTNVVPDQTKTQTNLLEEENGAITYTANLLGSRPRIMDVCVPKVSEADAVGTEWKNYLEKMDNEIPGLLSCRMLNHLKLLQQRLENEETAQPTPTENAPDNYLPPDDYGLLALQNRPPWWNVELGSFVLNFGGRVSVASVKNFQLCDKNNEDYVMLQFGRIQGRHSFTMDFQHPLTAVQAFAIAISSLQSKISFG